MLSRLRARVARRMLRLAFSAHALGQQEGPPPDLTDITKAETAIGSLYLPRDDLYITPTLRERGVWEPHETELLEQRLAPGQTFIDIGAHVGYFSCLAARRVGPRGLVLAFEPHPRNYGLLLANLWRNGFTNAVALPWAVTDRNGFSELHVQRDNTGGHLLYTSSPGEMVVPVRTVALDQLAALRPPLDVVKIDAQGVDDLAVRGMVRLLNASPRATALVEFWPFGIRQRGVDPQEVLDLYRDLGYRFDVQVPSEPGPPRPLSDEDVLRHCAGENGTLHVNLVLERGK